MRRVVVAMFGAVTLIAGCGSTAAPPTATSGAPTSASSASSAVTTAPTSGPQTIRLSRTADKTTVAARIGDELDISLDSTYWTFTTPASVVLHAVGTPASVTDPSCVPGGGCGTITARYRAATPGRALVSADRTLCGEALHCNGIQHFQLTVVVGS